MPVPYIDDEVVLARRPGSRPADGLDPRRLSPLGLREADHALVRAVLRARER